MDEANQEEARQPEDSASRRHVTRSSSRNQLIKQSHKRQNAAIMAELNGSSEQAAEDGASAEQLAQAPEPGCSSTVVNQIEVFAGRNNRISSTIDILNHDDEQADQLDGRARLQADAEANKVQRISQTNPRNTIEGDADPRNPEIAPAQRPHGAAVTESKGLSTLRAQIQYSLKKNNFLDS